MIFVRSSMFFSIANLIAISIDRFLILKYPLKHRVILTGKRAYIVIVLVRLIILVLVTFCCLVLFKMRLYLII